MSETTTIKTESDGVVTLDDAGEAALLSLEVKRDVIVTTVQVALTDVEAMQLAAALTEWVAAKLEADSILRDAPTIVDELYRRMAKGGS